MGWLAFTVSLVGAAGNVTAALVALVGARDRGRALAFAWFTTALALWSFASGIRALPGFVEQFPTANRIAVFSPLILPAAGFHSMVVLARLPHRVLRLGIIPAYFATIIFLALQFDYLVFAGARAFEWGAFEHAGPLLPHFVAFVTVCSVAGIFAVARDWFYGADASVRLQTGYVALGASVLFAGGLCNFLVNFGWAVRPFGVLGNLVFVGFIAQAAVRHRLLDVDALVIKAATWGVVASLALGMPVGLLSWAVGVGGTTGALIIFGLAAVCVALSLAIFTATRAAVEDSVERTLFQPRFRARKALVEFSESVTTFGTADELASRSVAMLVEALGLNAAGVYLVDEGGDRFRCRASAGDGPVPDVVASAVQDSEGPWAMLLPVRWKELILGYLAVGPKRSGAAFDDMDLTLLALVASQVATALQGLRYASEIDRQQTEIGGLLKQIEVRAVAPLVHVPRRRLFEEIVGSSEALDKVLSQTERVAPSILPVLIAGETGTGKELLARAIHRLSPRAEKSFVCVNCPAIPQELAESHLFGHCRGAFTGATEARDGAFELADGGTIFLDEVGDLPLAVQVKLLRVLQEGEVQRLGSRTARTVDVRIVSATNRDLREDVRLGRFRDDLYHRLAGIRLELPPLRARHADVRALATLFFERAVQRHQRSLRGISVGAMELLCHYPWPGNIRELQNVVERAVLLSTDELIDHVQVAEILAENSGAAAPLAMPATSNSTSLSGALREEKLRMVASALSQVGGNQAAAARLLGMSRSNLSRLLKRYGLRSDETDR